MLALKKVPYKFISWLHIYLVYKIIYQPPPVCLSVSVDLAGLYGSQAIFWDSVSAIMATQYNNTVTNSCFQNFCQLKPKRQNEMWKLYLEEKIQSFSPAWILSPWWKMNERARTHKYTFSGPEASEIAWGKSLNFFSLFILFKLKKLNTILYLKLIANAFHIKLVSGYPVSGCKVFFANHLTMVGEDSKRWDSQSLFLPFLSLR